MFCSAQSPSTMPKRSPPTRPITSLADFDDDGVGRLVAVGVVDGAELVDADREIGAGRARAQAAGDDLVERLAQTLLVEMAGELVVMRELLESELGRLARSDEAEHALDAGEPAARDLGRAAIVHPGVFPVVEAQTVLDVEFAAALDMGGKALFPQRQIVAVDTRGEIQAARHPVEPKAVDSAVPFETVASGVPYIVNVACRRERSEHRLFVVRFARFSLHTNDTHSARGRTVLARSYHRA